MELSQKSMEAQFYEEYFRTRFVYDPRREEVWREVVLYLQKHYIPQDSSVLELGAGYCHFINNVVSRERHAVDIYSRFGEYATEGVQTHVGNCTDLGHLGDDTVDIVFASNLFEHLIHDDLLATLAETLRVMRVGGRLIILQPNFKYCYKTYFDDYTHLQIFTAEGMYDLLEMAGLRVVDSHPRFLPVNMKSTLKLKLPMLWLLVRAYLPLPYKPLAAQMLVVAEKPAPRDD
jgi:SAM-dependent methyltransferase